MTKVWVATLDTGGITYSASEFVGVGLTEEEACRAVFTAWRKAGLARSFREYYGRSITTPEALAEWYGMRTVEVAVGKAVEVG